MERVIYLLARLVFFILVEGSYSILSPSGVNYEVVALIDIKNDLHDPYNVMEKWDATSVDPCSWRMVTCSQDGYVSALGLPSLGLSGTLSSMIGNLTNLQSVLLQNNDITGPIPDVIGKLEKLQTLDLSDNKLFGDIPDSIGNLKNLNYLVAGNPLICGLTSQNNCSLLYPESSPFSPDAVKEQSNLGSKRHVAVAFGTSFAAVFSIIIIIGLLSWWRCRHNQQIFFDVNEKYDPEVRLGHLRKYTFKELRAATSHFNSKNILGKGGFGIVYKGRLHDGTVVAVKRLKDYNAVGGEIQFQTEVELISLAVHRNLLRIWGFCLTENERLLVYPYMPNGSVASRLKDHVHGRPVLDWFRRKRIALGTARGLTYLHEQCVPKIIHRDVKAANILLDEDFEAVVGDFGLAKLLDHQDSHVTTAVRGTVGHIAPEYLSTGQSSEKTDVFGFGILLLELITGLKAVDFGRVTNQKGVMLDWVKKLHREGKLNLMVDKDLENNFDRMELHEMVQVALLCTHFNPSHRPKMSEVLRMLEGHGLAEKWEQSQNFETPRYRSSECRSQRYSDFIEESSLVVEAIELSGPR
ncbi:protein NSP-INTERACTING KINASE 3-like isoform X3 [Henckelia pumila]|uniref:protein NSP-INTERACTING KINASE 3-like isoform X3 n=1 Tax=Henckelia pumila TaxID=405737 RepID=UPI003C6DBA09